MRVRVIMSCNAGTCHNVIKNQEKLVRALCTMFRLTLLDANGYLSIINANSMEFPVKCNENFAT